MHFFLYMDNLACTKFFRFAKSSIPNMELINKKYLIEATNSKIIIFMRGGILSFSPNKGFKAAVLETFWHIWKIFRLKKPSVFILQQKL